MNRVAVITGAASGIGLGIAKWFAQDGYRVAMLDQQEDLAKAASDELNATGCRTLAEGVDVTDRGRVESALQRVRRDLGPIEIMITSAGVSAYAPFTELTMEQWQRVMDINLNGTFHALQLAIPDMLKAGWGRIVTISSASAQLGAPSMAHYAASKGGVIALTKAIAREFADRGITANTIPPSVVETPMGKKSHAEGNFVGYEALAKMTPVGRVGTPEDIAAACAWLCSEHAGFVTGQQINVNGGWYL